MDAPKSHKALLKLALPITHGIVNTPGSFLLQKHILLNNSIYNFTYTYHFVAFKLVGSLGGTQFL
jgi:hypothetical protein